MQTITPAQPPALTCSICHHIQVIDATPDVHDPALLVLQQQIPVSRWVPKGVWQHRLQALDELEGAQQGQATAEAELAQVLENAAHVQAEAASWQAIAENNAGQLVVAEGAAEEARGLVEAVRRQAAAEVGDLHSQTAALVERIQRQADERVEAAKRQAAAEVEEERRQAAAEVEEAKRRAAAEVEKVEQRAAAEVAAARAEAGRQKQLAEQRRQAMEHLKEKLRGAEKQVEEERVAGMVLLRDLERTQWLLYEAEMGAAAAGGAEGAAANQEETPEVVVQEQQAAGCELQAPRLASIKTSAKPTTADSTTTIAAAGSTNAPAAAPCTSCATSSSATTSSPMCPATPQKCQEATSASSSRAASSDGSCTVSPPQSSPLAPCTPLRHSSTGLDTAATLPSTTACNSSSRTSSSCDGLFPLPCTAATAKPVAMVLPQLRSKEQLQQMLRRQLMLAL